MKLMLIALFFICANVSAGTVIFEGTVPEGVTFKEAYAYYQSSNCPYFCFKKTVDGTFSVKNKKFKLSVPIKEKIGVPSFNYINVTFVMKTKAGNKQFEYRLPTRRTATQDIVINDYPISCSMKLLNYTHWQTEDSGCTSPEIQIGFNNKTTVKNVTLTLSENQFEDGVLLVDENFGGYGVKIFDNGINGVGVRSKLILNHKISGAIMPKGEYRIYDLELTKDGSQVLRARVYSANYELEGYFTTAPFHPEQNTYVIPVEAIRAKCPDAKLAWIMKKRSNDGKDKISVSCL